MRLIGMALALGAIVWVMLQAAGGGDAESVIPEGQQQALLKAQGMEQLDYIMFEQLKDGLGFLNE